MMTVVALLCHILEGIAAPICHEVIVTRQEMSMARCQMGSQMGIANWKQQSIYKGEQWTVEEVECVPGDSYQPKDAI